MARGRPPLGAKNGQELDGSAESNRRLHVLLETLGGSCSVAIWKLEAAPRSGPLRRGFAAQRPGRTVERSLRIAVLAFRRWTARLGLSRRDAAYRLALSPHTLASSAFVVGTFAGATVAARDEIADIGLQNRGLCSWGRDQRPQFPPPNPHPLPSSLLFRSKRS